MVVVEGCFHKPMHYFIPGTLEMSIPIIMGFLFSRCLSVVDGLYVQCVYITCVG